MQRITEKDLKNLCFILNKETNNPVSYWNNEKKEANPGNFHIDFAYGGTKLVQTCNKGGGVRDITHGFRPKRETYDLIQQFRAGVRYMEESKVSE